MNHLRALPARRLQNVFSHLACCATSAAGPVSCSAIQVEAFGGPDVMQLKTKELPGLTAGQVLVDVRASGVNPSDTYVRLGPAGPYSSKPSLLPKELPYTPGKDGAGFVEAVGPGFQGLKVGDRVYTTHAITGTYASKAICSADTVFPLPDRISFSQGASVGVPCTTALYALYLKAQVKPGSKVFIHGASGAVGLAAVQIAKASLNCSLVVGTAGTVEGEQAVADAGADEVLNHRAEGYLEEVRRIAPEGYDVILEMAGQANLPGDLTLAAPRTGRVCIIGSKSEAVAVNPRFFMNNEATVMGISLPLATREEKIELHRMLWAMMTQGSLSPVVSLELPLREAPAAHVEVMTPSRGGAVGNIVLIP